MIRVFPKPEYAEFDRDVRVPGQGFLEINSNPSSKEFRQHNYWTRAKRELIRAYGRCAYTSLRVRRDDPGGGASVDHFRPKSKFPELAYEWKNYRLCRTMLNGFKGNSEDVVDPFLVRDNWFAMKFTSCLIHPDESLDDVTHGRVSRTIDVLKLNEPDLVTERITWMVNVAKCEISIPYLRSEYRFLALQIERQNFEERLDEFLHRVEST